MSAPCALVVEAPGDHRGRLVGLLEGEGFRVDLAEDGRSALQRLQRRPRPVLIVITLTGSADDVSRVAEMICQDPTLEDVPVVAVGAGEEGAEGFTASLALPVEAEALAACLDGLLGHGGSDPLAPVRRNLRALLAADGGAEVSLQEALDTVDRLVQIQRVHDTPRPSTGDGHKA
jgi:CheY-like chemotaxis protein